MNEQDENKSLNEEKAAPIGRRRFLKRAGIVAFGGALTLSGLAACSDTPATTPTAVAVNPTSAATSSAALPTTTAALPTATSLPLTATTAPTATAVPTITPLPSPTPVVFKPIRFGVLGDIRTAGPKPPQVAYGIIDRMKTENPAAVVLVGDIINAETTAQAVREQWNNINLAIAELAPGVILPTVGNHETNGLKSVLPYFNEAFPKLPENGPAGYKGLTYSYDVGSVHFVSITSEHPNRFHALGDDQLTWLEKDLAANKQRYSIVFSHDPAYPVGPHAGSSLDAYPKDRDQLWKIMQKYKVTAYICGHEHLYNRSQQGGLAHLVIGTSGSAIYGGYGGEFYHYGIFDVTEQAINVKIYDNLGKQRDAFNLT